jgi:hypothetical protein
LSVGDSDQGPFKKRQTLFERLSGIRPSKLPSGQTDRQRACKKLYEDVT